MTAATPEEEPLVALRGVEKRFANGTLALSGVDLAVRRGEFLSLVGPSGCGKSTLLRLIAGLAEPSAGRIAWAAPGQQEERGRGTGVAQGCAGNAAQGRAGDTAQRRAVGFVFQEPTLMPWATALANARLPLRLAGVPRAEAEARAAAALAQVGLAGFERAWPRELSGGMRMRVSIARALVTRPALLLMDEPFAALDEPTRHRLNDDLLALWAASGITVIFVTHSVFESAYLSGRVVVMAPRPGRVAAELHQDGGATAPHRGPEYRTSADYAARCRETSHALAAATARPAAA